METGGLMLELEKSCFQAAIWLEDFRQNDLGLLRKPQFSPDQNGLFREEWG